MINEILIFLLSNYMAYSKKDFHAILGEMDSRFDKAKFKYYRKKIIDLYDADLQCNNISFTNMEIYSLENEVILELEEKIRRLKIENMKLRRNKFASYVFKKIVGLISKRKMK